MKKTLIFSMMLCGMVSLFSSEIKKGHNYVQYPQTRVRFLNNGWMVLQRENKMFSHGSWVISTPAGYYSFGNVKNSLKNPSEGVWEFKADFPADKEKNLITFRQNMEMNPIGLLDVGISWESKNPKGNKGSFYNIGIAMKEIENRDILIGKERFTVKNIQKYGVFNKIYENVEVTFFAWDEKRCFKILCSGKVRLIGSCTKDKNFSMRIYPTGKDVKNLSFSVKVN